MAGTCSRSHAARRISMKQQIEELAQQLDELKVQFQDLQAKHTTLSLQQSLLACCCDVLHSLRTGAVHKGWMSCQDGWLPAELPLLQDLAAVNGLLKTKQQQQDSSRSTHTTLSPLAYEQGVQQRSLVLCPGSGNQSNSSIFSRELLSKRATPSGVAPATAAEAAAHEAHHHLVSPNKPLGLFEYCLQHPPVPGAACMTLEQLVQSYSAMVKEMALNLNLLEQQQDRDEDICSGSEPPLLVLKRLILQHSRRIFTIMLLHPDDLLHKFRVVNVHTMELSDNPEQAWKRTSWMLDKIQLSEQQQQALIAGADVIKRLLDNLQAERQQLSAQQVEQAQQRLSTGRAVDLQAQQDCALRLQVLVKKERLLLTCASAYVLSVLDIQQMARCCTLAWPWTPHMGMLAAVLGARHRARQMQEQQQQQQQQQHKQVQLQQQQQQQQQQEARGRKGGATG